MKKLILLALFLYTCFSLLNAQAYKKGGTQRAKNDWNAPSNWSTNQVPYWADETVVIPDVSTVTKDDPIITSVVKAMPSLEIHSGVT